MVPPSTAPIAAIGSSSAHLDVSCFIHTPCYCEENVYFLCKKMIELGLADSQGLDLFVVVISNDDRQVPLWWQIASKEEDGLVLWDYHVICIQSKINEHGQHHYLVWDLDSRLPLPCSLKQYLEEAIRPSLPLHGKFRRLFRVIHASKFLLFFASDRSHMRDSNGKWLAPPPSYNPIVSQDGTVNNINEYIQIGISEIMETLEDSIGLALTSNLGIVVTQTQLEDLFSLLEDRLR